MFPIKDDTKLIMYIKKIIILVYFEFYQMNKIWRRQYLNTFIDIPNNPQSDFLDLITRTIKNIKKKQDLLFKMIEQNHNESQEKSQILKKIDKIQMAIKFQKILQDQKDLFKNLDQFKSQPYYQTKAYLYTILVRINQICQASKQKYAILRSAHWVSNLKEIKQQIMDEYNNLIHKQEYDIGLLILKFTKFQNQSIHKFIPKRLNRSNSPLKVSLQPIGKMINIQRIRSAQSQINLKPAYSLQIPKEKILKKINDQQLQTRKKIDKSRSIISRKLMSSKKAELKSRKREEEPFQKAYSRNFNKNYKILEVKQVCMQQSFYYRMELQREMRVRNQKIKETISEWNEQHAKIRGKMNWSERESTNEEEYY